MASIPPKAREAIELARRGEFARAILSGEAALRDAPDDGPLELFLGLLHARRLDLHEALPHLRRAVALLPGDILPRIELARALIGIERLDEAEVAIRDIASHGPHATQLLKTRALIHQRRGAHREAAELFEIAVARDGRDFESWGHLGASRLALGDADGAVHALGRSLALKPDQPLIRARLAEAQAAAGQADEGLRSARAQARSLPYDPMVRVTIARLEDLLGRPEAAEAALAEALALDPKCRPALFAMADLLERDNRLDALEDVIGRIEASGLPPGETALLRAQLLYRRGDLRGALTAAMLAPETLGGGGKALLVGQIRDRLGEHAAAFDAFVEMNRACAAQVDGAARMARDYRAMVARRTGLTTTAGARNWSPARPFHARPAPIFLFGFPRSGTTLIDTMLMGHSGALVLEERPVLHAVAEKIGRFERLAGLDQAAVDGLRNLYFETLDAIAPEGAGRLVIDKLPLGIVDTALVHRVFPDARFVFVERHPCDVVLSCFMTRFDPKGGMANFLDLGDAAALYDAVMAHWRQCRAVFPLDVHTIRYEATIADAEGELRSLATFLGLDWDERLLDHRRTAAERSFIATPSYAQVAEPLYTRARGRWEKYREQMAPVLPILAPWAEEMGYEV
ncbi:MAG TPA: sulfotransferase [Allosphingosinicella sp.]